MAPPDVMLIKFQIAENFIFLDTDIRKLENVILDSIHTLGCDGSEIYSDWI
jgi:hypothetical protein